MSDPLNDNVKPKPSLGTLQELQDNWTQDEIDAVCMVAKVTVATGASSGIEASIPMGAEIIGATVRATGTVGGGTLQVKTGATSPTAITDTIACATDKAIDYAAEIDDASNVNIVGVDGIKVFANVDSVRGVIYIHYIKP